MRRIGIAPNVSILTMLFAVGLAGCESVTYVRSQLEEIPVPSPALLQPVSEPDCVSGQAKKHDAGQHNVSNSSSDGRDFEQVNSAPTKGATAKEEKTASMKSEDSVVNKDSTKSMGNVEKLKTELNCYRDAADQMRRRIRKLQDSVAETADAVTKLKNKYQYLAGSYSDGGSHTKSPAPGNF
jgi:hypothetical protein